MFIDRESQRDPDRRSEERDSPRRGEMFIDRKSPQILSAVPKERDSPCKGEIFIDRESPEILSAVRRSGTQLERFGRVSSAPPNGGALVWASSGYKYVTPPE